MSAAELLAAYDAQLRGVVPDPLPEGHGVERDGPLLRLTGLGRGGFIEYRDLGGLEGAALDDLIARQVDVFRARGEAFEWKLHSHDQPSDLADRLRAAGFQAEETETVVIAPVAAVARATVLPEGVVLREVGEQADLRRIAGRSTAIWGDDRDAWLAESLAAEQRADPSALTILIAEAGATVVCAAWIRFAPATEFATLWGGATLPAWRGRGIYRALVAHRANLAAARGYRYVQVDASDDSRPILERLGFVPVTTTTPFIWSPSGGGRRERPG
jgi:GNAT superfamily N-acetyltransferase